MIMRGKDERSGGLFSYVDLEARVPQNHPLRAIRALTNATLAEMSEDFEALYAHTGRPGIAPGSCCGHFFCRLSIRSALRAT